MTTRGLPFPVTPQEVEALLHRLEGEVRVIDTPLNVIFLTPTTAYKMKRAVHFPFADFSSPIARRAAAMREIARNRAAGARIYRDVVMLTRSPDGELTLNGAGPVVEWLVRMHRFDESQTLDLVHARGGLSDALLIGLGTAVADAQMHAPIRDAVPWLHDLETYLEQNRVAFRARPDLFPAERVSAFDQAMSQTLARLETLLEERGRIGVVRLLHGDLHLRNIVLIDGAPVPFDALEFDDALATGDQLYDVAFLLMDLLARGDRAAATTVMWSYLLAISVNDIRDPSVRRRMPLSGQFIAGLAALPFFIALRASIRAKVSAAAAEVNRDAARLAAEAEAMRYFALAERQLDPATPALIAIGGLSGTGKSRAARAIAPRLGRDPGGWVLPSDMMRKLVHGRHPTARLPAEAYSADATKLTYAKLATSASIALAAGMTIVIDAVFAHEEERALCAAIARAAEVPFVGLWLDAPLGARVARIEGRVNDFSDADAAVAARQETYALDDLTWTRIDATGTPDETRDRLLAALRAAGIETVTADV